MKCEQCGKQLNPIEALMCPVCRDCVDENYRKMRNEQKSTTKRKENPS